MGKRYGLWPGVVAFANDADMYCVPCAEYRYGNGAVAAVIAGTPGYEQYTDCEGDPLNVVLYGDAGLHGMHCGRCSACVCDEECCCYALPDEVEALLESEVG